MNGTNAISRRATVGYLGAALAAGVSAKWAVSWGSAADGDLLEIPLGAYVGVISDDEGQENGTSIAVLLEPGPVGMTSVSAYLCNGDDVADWFTADIAGNAISLISDRGTALEGTIGPAGIAGTGKLPAGPEQSFELHPASGAEGLYYVVRSADGRVYGASEGGVAMSIEATGDRIAGSFVLPGGIQESIDLPADSVSLDDRSRDSGEVVESASFRAIVVGSGSSLRIAGAMVDPRPPRRCSVVKRVVVLSDGSQQAEFVTVCNR